MSAFPLFFDLEDRLCLVLGGGVVAARRTRSLLESGARVRLVNGNPCGELRRLIAEGRIDHHAGPFSPALLAGTVLAFGAAEARLANRWLYEHCCKLGIPVNVADVPELCTFLMPSVMRRGPITVAVGSDGRAPILARMLRTQFDLSVPEDFGELAEVAGRYRKRVQQVITDAFERRQFWERLLGRSMRRRDNAAALTAELERGLNTESAGEPDEGCGRIDVIGAGPGEADLLTLRAAQRMQAADLLVIGRHVPEELLAKSRRDADRLYAESAAGAVIRERVEFETSRGRNVVFVELGTGFDTAECWAEVAQASGAQLHFVPGLPQSSPSRRAAA